MGPLPMSLPENKCNFVVHGVTAVLLNHSYFHQAQPLPGCKELPWTGLYTRYSVTTILQKGDEGWTGAKTDHRADFHLEA